jgi:hypothetical protein
LGAECCLEASGEAVDELGDPLEAVCWCGFGPAGEVGHRRRACVQPEKRGREVRDGLGDKLLLGVPQRRVVVLAILLDQGVRELVTGHGDLRVDRLRVVDRKDLRGGVAGPAVPLGQGAVGDVVAKLAGEPLKRPLGPG